MDETLFFESLSARFKPWHHSWPYVPESTTINPCLKIVIFYRTSPELPTLLVVSNLKGRCSFPDHISKICVRCDNKTTLISCMNNLTYRHSELKKLGWRHCQNTFSVSSFLRAGDVGGSLACVETPRSLKKNRKKKLGRETSLTPMLIVFCFSKDASRGKPLIVVMLMPGTISYFNSVLWLVNELPEKNLSL